MLSELIVNKRKIKDTAKSHIDIGKQIEKIVRDFLSEYSKKNPLYNQDPSQILQQIKVKLAELLS